MGGLVKNIFAFATLYFTVIFHVQCRFVYAVWEGVFKGWVSTCLLEHEERRGKTEEQITSVMNDLGCHQSTE